MTTSTGQISIYGPYLRDWWAALIDPTDPNRYRMVLTTADFVPSLDSDQHYSDLTGYEVYQGDWPQGGLTIENVAIALDTINNLVSLTHDPVTAAECTFSPAAARVVVVDWLSGAGASTRRLAFTWPLSPALAPVAQPVVIAAPSGLVGGTY